MGSIIPLKIEGKGQKFVHHFLLSPIDLYRRRETIEVHPNFTDYSYSAYIH